MFGQKWYWILIAILALAAAGCGTDDCATPPADIGARLDPGGTIDRSSDIKLCNYGSLCSGVCTNTQATTKTAEPAARPARRARSARRASAR